MADRAWMPDTLTMRMSMSTRSNGDFSTFSMATDPSSASATSYPHPPKRAVSMARWAGSSSTTKTEALGLLFMFIRWLWAPFSWRRRAARF